MSTAASSPRMRRSMSRPASIICGSRTKTSVCALRTIVTITFTILRERLGLAAGMLCQSRRKPLIAPIVNSITARMKLSTIPTARTQATNPILPCPECGSLRDNSQLRNGHPKSICNELRFGPACFGLPMGHFRGEASWCAYRILSQRLSRWCFPIVIQDMSPSMCPNCVWEHRPDVCSDTRNLEWGRKLTMIVDLFCTETVPPLDFKRSARAFRAPLTFALDLEHWHPDLKFPAPLISVNGGQMKT